MKKNYKPLEIEVIRFDENGIRAEIIWMSEEDQTPIFPFDTWEGGNG